MVILETLIPFQNQNKRIVNEEIIESESLYVEILQFMKQSLSLLGNVSENTQLLRFVDMALILVEPRINQLPPPPPTTTTTTTILNRLTSNKVKQKKRKNTSSVALSDILSHEHLFMTNIPTITITTVRSFINQIITKLYYHQLNIIKS